MCGMCGVSSFMVGIHKHPKEGEKMTAEWEMVDKLRDIELLLKDILIELRKKR